MHLAGDLVSFLTVKKENISTIVKVIICNAASYFFGPPCMQLLSCVQFVVRYLSVVAFVNDCYEYLYFTKLIWYRVARNI